MKDRLEAIKAAALAKINEADVLTSLNDVKVSVLGKKGELTQVLKGMKDVAPEDRPKVGQMVNEARQAIETALEEKSKKINQSLRAEKMKRETIDVTLPGIKPTIVILLLMNVGNVLNAGFEIQYLLGNGLVQKFSQTIDIYVLKWGISQGDYAIGTAAGIFKSLVSIILIVLANQIAKHNGEEQLF